MYQMKKLFLSAEVLLQFTKPKEGKMDEQQSLRARRNSMLVQIPLCAIFLTALFWHIFYLVKGYLPKVSVVNFTEKISYQLPFDISRFFDALAVGVFSVIGILIWYFIQKREENHKSANSGLVSLAFLVAICVFFVFLVSPVFATMVTVAGVIILNILIFILDEYKNKFKEFIFVSISMNLILALGISISILVKFGGVVGLAAMILLFSLYFCLSFLIFCILTFIKWGIDIVSHNRSRNEQIEKYDPMYENSD